MASTHPECGSPSIGSLSEVAAILYSLLETAKLVGVDPREYLRAALAAHVERGEALIPHDMLPPSQAPAA